MKIERICERCGSRFMVERREVNRGGGRFCTQSCSSKRQRVNQKPPTNLVALTCANPSCGRDFQRRHHLLKNSKSGLYFCSRACKDGAQRLGGISAIHPSHYGDGITAYRDVAFREYPSICMGCGYDKHVEVLEVHHRDKDRGNNKKENLAILCPTCHVECHLGLRTLEMVEA